jgi:S-formylglutathione hydrolase
MGKWIREEIAGRPADVFLPTQAGHFGLLDLHPVSGTTLAQSVVFSEVLEELGLTCLCPHAPECWWVDRPCPDFHPVYTPERYLLDAVLPYFATRWGLRPPAIGLSGISMGGQGALRLAFRHPHIFPVVAAIAPALEFHQWYGRGGPLDVMYDSKEQARQDTAILHLHPVQWPPHLFFCIDPTDQEWWRGADRLKEKMMALGVPHECDLSTQAGGHSWTYFEAMSNRALRFVMAGLEKQAKRLL